MEIRTGRYQNAGGIKASGLTPIGITNGNPRWPLSYKLAENARIFAPDRKDLFHSGLPKPIWRSRYIEQIEKDLGDNALAYLQQLDTKYSSHGPVLLCFEDLRKPGLWCHRTFLAEWLNERFKLNVTEIEEIAHSNCKAEALRAAEQLQFPLLTPIDSGF